MNVFKQILASFLLCVFGIMILHNAFPHVHQTHETVSGAENYTGHSHHPDEHNNVNSHQHSSRYSQEQDPENEEHGSLLSFLLNNHAHTFHNHEYIQIANTGCQCPVDEFVPVAAVFAVHYSTSEYTDQSLHRYSLFKQAYYINPSQVNCSLRAPPYSG